MNERLSSAWNALRARWKTLSFAGAGALLLVGLGLWLFRAPVVEVEWAEAASGPFESGIEEDGRSRVRDRYIVTAPLAGHLRRVPWREGDAVQQDQPLVWLEPLQSPLLDERSTREQRARAAAADVALARANTQVDAALIALQKAVMNTSRSSALAGEGFVSRNQLETSLLELKAAERQWQVSRETAHVAAEERRQAWAQLDVMNHQLTSAAAHSADRPAAPAYLLRAPVSGLVLKLVQNQQTPVAMGAPVLELGDPSNPEVVVQLLSSDALSLSPGTRAELSAWGAEAAPVLGRVRRVEPAAFTKVSALGVEEQRMNVIIDPDTPLPAGDGYMVRVKLIVQSAAQALQVPVSAVFPVVEPSPAAAGGHAVYILQEDRALLRPVKVAARGRGMAWISEGLQAGDRVVVYPPAVLTPGSRVKAVKR